MLGSYGWRRCWEAAAAASPAGRLTAFPSPHTSMQYEQCSLHPAFFPSPASSASPLNCQTAQLPARSTAKPLNCQAVLTLGDWPYGGRCCSCSCASHAPCAGHTNVTTAYSIQTSQLLQRPCKGLIVYGRLA
eukprot:167491-Chlamydomonas_euryale.AAC.2